MTDFAIFDLASSGFSSNQSVTLIDAARQTVTFHCSNGRLFIDGEDQGVVTDENPVLIGGLAWFCSGNTLRTFIKVR